jgi:DNA polymerase-1
MILQVHDELVFDVPRNEIDIVRPIIIREMENAMVLPNGVPIKAESGIGDNWLEAH